MSIVYNGNGTNVAPTVGASVRVAIASSAGVSGIGTTIRVVTSTPHGFHTADTIEIEGHTGNTAANGVWVASVSGSTSLDLNGSSANGTGGATGYAIDYELLPAITLPSNGELGDAGVVDAALEGAYDLGPFLYRRAGLYRLYAAWDTTVASPGTPGLTTNIWSHTTGITSGGGWQALAGAGALLSFPGIPAPVTHAGDLMEVRITGSMSNNASITGLTIGYSTNGGANVPVGGADQWINSGGPFTLLSRFVVASGTFNVGILACINPGSTSPSNVDLGGGAFVSVTQYRRN